MRVLWVPIACVLCACPSAKTPQNVGPTGSASVTTDPDHGACAALCAKERSCDKEVDVAKCNVACESDRARMKPGFVAAYGACYGVAMKTCTNKSAADLAALREQAHLHCFDTALARFPRDDQNQRDMAEAVCARGERCQGIGKAGRDACMQATLSPKEPEVKLGQRLVDGFRRTRVLAFRSCVDAAPCPKLDTFDAAVNGCYESTIEHPPAEKP